MKLPLSLLLGATLVPMTTLARSPEKARDQAAARAAVQRGEILPVLRVLKLAQRAAPGDVIEVELKRRDDGSFKYEVKTLARDGRVREVELNARTGVLLKVEDD